MTPTKFAGYYVTKNGEVFRDSVKSYDAKNAPPQVRVGVHYRGGDSTIQRGRNYPSVNISLKENGKTIKQIRYYVHRLVAETFIENPHCYTEIDHINRDKRDNRVENLRWCDKKMNRANQ